MRLRDNASATFTLGHLFLEQLLKRLLSLGFDGKLVNWILLLSLRILFSLIFTILAVVTISEALLVQEMILAIILVLRTVLVGLMRMAALVERALETIAATNHVAVLESRRCDSVA